MKYGMKLRINKEAPAEKTVNLLKLLFRAGFTVCKYDPICGTTKSIHWSDVINLNGVIIEALNSGMSKKPQDIIDEADQIEGVYYSFSKNPF